MKNLLILMLAIATFACTNSNQATEREEEPEEVTSAEPSYEELGLKTALETQAVLGQNLRSAIESKGAENALEFCNVQAIPLTDSMAVALNARIKRVTDKPRNPANAANAQELAHIDSLKNSLREKRELRPAIHEIDGKMVGYYPIVTNQMCLQCHGQPNENIEAATLEKIQSLYPQDQAIGYKENEIRGIWVVEMEKE